MKKILVADDSVTIQKVIALTFADEPFEVQSVGTGAEALELVKSWKPDVVLADVIMPQMNGYELCKAVKQLDPAGPIPVLLLAGTFEAFDEEEAKSVGADDFITKPFESGELIVKVKALIGETVAAPPAEPVSAAVEAAVPTPPEAAPEVTAQADAPAPATKAPEPDIWDILSDSGDVAQPQAAQSGAPGPGFGPIEDAGVVDVGSFDVGIGRPDSPPSPPEPAPAPEPAPEPVAPPAPQEVTPQAAPPVEGMPQDLEERSRVEDMEKDFFGFETGAVEEVPATSLPDDAIEEVTFEMEQPPAAPEADAQEVSFVVPEPVPDQAAVTGDTISPEFMAPEPPSAPTPEPAPPADSAAQPMPEPPLELPVDLNQDLPEGFSPEPAAEQMVEVPASPSAEPVTDVPSPPVPEPPAPEPVAAPSQAAPDVPDDAAIRKIIEEKVEKIAWEVVPEMAEVIIREAIQKIKDGS